jgi:site-specific recombinase XerD
MGCESSNEALGATDLKSRIVSFGAGIVAVLKLSGHSKLSTREPYTHLSPVTMMKAYPGAFPQAKPAE